jgi:hypothetical protein
VNERPIIEVTGTFAEPSRGLTALTAGGVVSALPWQRMRLPLSAFS